MKYLIPIVLFFSFNVFSREKAPCNFNDVTNGYHHELTSKEHLRLRQLCQNMDPIRNQLELESVLQFFLDQNNFKNDGNRHRATQKLNECRPTAESKVLVIAFEGTGAYEPLMPATINDFNQCFAGRIDPKFNYSLNYTLSELFKKKFGRSPKWSALQSGIQSVISKTEGAEAVDWYSFPSEEAEALAGVTDALTTNVVELYDDIKDSIASNPKGIQNARDCISRYVTIAKALGIKPKIIIASHSSGGRSLVKYAEHVKKDLGIKIDLAFSIDPVKEAHEALKEVVPQKIGEPMRFLKWKITGGPYPYSAVWSRSQPSSLYKPSNVSEHISFYQTEDREGLKLGGDMGRFGIHGSRIKNAENIHIGSIGVDAHGPIGYQKEVVERFQDELSDLLK